jgi:hypothetical protein
MTLIINLSEDLEAALVAHAQAEGVDAAGYARRVLARALGMEEEPGGPPLKTGRGLLAKYGPAPSAEEIDANRADMFRGFGENAP